jgi:hypothetical protein
MAFKLNQKQSATLQAVLMFYIISNPVLYRITDSLIGGTVSFSGAPTTFGLILHSIVFGIVAWMLMQH